MNRARVTTWSLMLGAVLPDSDVFRDMISHNDLLILTWHRSYTHSLVCLPIFAVLLAIFIFQASAHAAERIRIGAAGRNTQIHGRAQHSRSSIHYESTARGCRRGRDPEFIGGKRSA